MIVGSPTILNLVPGGVMKCVHVNQVNKNIEIQFKIMNGAAPYNVPEGVTCTIRGTKGDAFGYAAEAAVTAGSNVITVTLTEQLTAVAGAGNIFELVFVGAADDMKVSTENFILAVERQAMGEDTVISDSDLSYAEQVLDQLQSVGAVNAQVQQNKANLAAEISRAQAAEAAETAARQAADNTLQSDINAEASTRATTDASLQSQINQLVAPSGSAPSAAEVENARVGADGTVYQTLGDAIRTQVTDVKSAIRQVSEASYMVVVEKGESANASGEIVPFHIRTGDTVTVSTVDGSTFGSVQFRLYDANGQYIDYYALSSSYGNARTFTNQYAETFYVGITTVSTASPDKYLAVNKSNMFKLELDGLSSLIDNNSADIAELDTLKPSKSIVNRFDKSTVEANKYISVNTGDILTGNNFSASGFINVGDLTAIWCSYTHIIAFYDATKTFIPGSGQTFNTINSDNSIARPENAVYMRTSVYTSDLDKVQVGAKVSRNNYVPYGAYTLPDMIVNKSQVIDDGTDVVTVDASGDGDYTSFTLAVKENYGNGKNIRVMPGTYDIVAEYVAIWGQEAVDSMADADTAIFDGWQYGVRMGGKKFTFVPGAHLVCDWTGHTVNGTHRFSALRVETDVEIIGLDLDCTATFYAIHDDYGTNVPYTVRYENCRVIGHNITNANCIGGGCKKYSRHILKNCYFDNNLTGSATVRYHNTNAEGAEPEIYVSNCYFNNWFTPRWYGTQTTKMKVYVNNCEARSIHKLAESSSYNVDNVELYKWCNTETAPVT